MTDNALITADELAGFLSLNLSTIKKWTAAGRIPCYRIGKKAVRYDTKRIARWLRAKESNQQALAPNDAMEQANAC